MTRNLPALAVDLGGLRQLVERRGKSFALLELVQNAWDEDGVTRVDIHMRAEGRSRVRLVITDDAPEGFHDLTHAYTLYAPSRKKADAEKRGRFNVGEKLVIALADSFKVETTTGAIEIDVLRNKRHVLRSKRDRGSSIEAVLRMNTHELTDALAAFATLLPPRGITTTLNGTAHEWRAPIETFDVALQTEIADEFGFLRPTRRMTRIEVHQPLDDGVGVLYEMGIPVVETGDRYHVNVMQKVPLNVDRDNVPPAFLRDVRAHVLNVMATRLTADDAASNWVNEALEDEHVTKEAVSAVLDRRFGEKRVVFDMHDQEANRIALSTGYSVIPGRALSGAAWGNVRRFEAALPAGRVTPSPKPFHAGGKPLTLIDSTDMTERQRVFVDQVAAAHRDLLGRVIDVILANDRDWPFNAVYGDGRVIINVASVEPSLQSESTLRTIIHEFGHHFGDHLTHAFDDGMALVAARWVLRAAKRGKTS